MIDHDLISISAWRCAAPARSVRRFSQEKPQPEVDRRSHCCKCGCEIGLSGYEYSWSEDGLPQVWHDECPVVEDEKTKAA